MFEYGTWEGLQMEHGDNHITVIDEDGNENCEILFTFESEEFGKTYVLYYPSSAEKTKRRN